MNSEADKPAKQKVKRDAFDQLSFRTDRVESLQQQGADQSLGRDGFTTEWRIERVKACRQISQRAIHQAADNPQRMVRTHPLFKINIAEQGTSHRVPAPQCNLDQMRKQ
jgi:hypothetical protein